ncbi:MAG: ferrous iron transport protein A [Oscillospiraceae bacterium]|nr:ferrous iron transport protein A [Oscillospiraceae bacterium]
MSSLLSVPLGERAVVLKISTEKELLRRFYDIGLIPGATVTCLHKSPFGDPYAIEVSGSVIAVRKKDLKKIFIKEAKIN